MSKYERDYIVGRVPSAALFEQMAEECSELAHACLKAARALRNENPTPVGYHEALDKISEEFTDVMLVASMLPVMEIDSYLYAEKLTRWFERVRDN